MCIAKLIDYFSKRECRLTETEGKLKKLPECDMSVVAGRTFCSALSDSPLCLVTFFPARAGTFPRTCGEKFPHVRGKM